MSKVEMYRFIREVEPPIYTVYYQYDVNNVPQADKVGEVILDGPSNEPLVVRLSEMDLTIGECPNFLQALQNRFKLSKETEICFK